ncbi:unnamed protein product [Paramecium octaurelia]|uniref:Uncharacterized protein n=1 Tax=Paramecium octaurelia TaxID=43137 RepID=A0A8S1TXR9_PAROT|nr:unnamed protein product [Paramecium octaurelia]
MNLCQPLFFIKETYFHINKLTQIKQCNNSQASFLNVSALFLNQVNLQVCLSLQIKMCKRKYFQKNYQVLLIRFQIINPKKALKMIRIVNPYKSNWANILLNKHYKVEVTCQGNKWVIKKATEDEPSKSMVGFLSSLPKPMQNQGKLFSNTASKQTKNRLNKFIIDQHRQCAFSPNEARYQQNSSLPNLNTNKNEGNNHQNNNNIYNTKKNNKNNNNDIDEKFKPKNNIDNIIKIRLNSESPKQMPIFDINFIKTLQQFKQ